MVLVVRVLLSLLLLVVDCCLSVCVGFVIMFRCSLCVVCWLPSGVLCSLFGV